MFQKQKVLGAFLIASGLALLLPIFMPVPRKLISRTPVELPIEAKEIPVTHNKYGLYLAGLMAQRDQDYPRMEQAFEQVLAEEPENISIKTSVYLMKAISGEMPAVLPLAQDLQTLKKPELLTDYVLIADAFRRQDYAAADTLLTHKIPYGADGILVPTLRAWLLAGQGRYPEAFQALEPLKKPQFQALYEYYRGLLALAKGDKTVADQSFRQMNKHSDKAYPSLSVLVFVPAFYRQQDVWRAGHPLYDKMQAFLTKNPAIQDIFQNVPAPEITPTMGAAIAFYDVSVALSPLKVEETCLILNELALYLYPEATAPKVWGGELMEAAGNPGSANRMYERLTRESDVLTMKRVRNLIAMNRQSEAIPLLAELEKHLPNDAYLQSVIGDVGVHLKNYPQAITAYTRAAELFQSAHLPAKAAEAFLALGATYDEMKDTAQAEQALLTSVNLNPENATALNYLGYLWLNRRKNVDEAFQMVQKALTLSPDDPNIMDSVALGYYLKQDYDKALELSEASTDKLPFSSVAYAHLGDIYAALGRTREARYQYRKALDLTSDITPELRAELMRKLKN